MKKYFKPLMEEKTNLASNEAMAKELDVSVFNDFFVEKDDKLDQW